MYSFVSKQPLFAFTIYNLLMKISAVALILLLLFGLACNKSSAPTSGVAASKSDPLQQKLQDYAGASATNCGRLDVKATADQSKSASDCALQASQGKHPFFVAYDMPGMAVGVAGNADGKLFTVQAQGTGSSADVKGGDCPSQLRIASSGRVTCFAPGDMGSMSGSHAAGSVPEGMANRHGGATPHQ